MGNVYGYIRVSSHEQNEARQALALQALGIDPDRIHMDKQSGKNFKRPQYRALLRRLRPGDLLCVASLDRLGRNYSEIRRQWAYLTRNRGVDIQILDMPLLDTRRAKDLLGAFIAELVLQVLSFVAQNERENILRRQAEGIAAARLRGVRFGRKLRPLPDMFAEVRALWRAGTITASEAARRCGMARSSFRYRAKKGH